MRILLILLLCGCSVGTRITVPPQIINPNISDKVPPIEYLSSKNISISFSKSADGSTSFTIIGDASSVIKSRGDAATAIITKSGEIIPLAGTAAGHFVKGALP